MSISKRLASHVADATYEDLSPRAIELTKQSILDAIGVTLGAGHGEDGCQAFIELARETGGPGPCTVIGQGFRTSAPMAAFANGAMAHALDFED